MGAEASTVCTLLIIVLTVAVLFPISIWDEPKTVIYI